MSEVSLKEYFDTRLLELEKRLQEQREYDQRALQLQATEYERRLESLNNEHGRVDRIVQTKVNREEWEAFHKNALKADYIGRAEFLEYKEVNSKERARSIGQIEGQQKLSTFLYFGITLLISLTAAAVAFWRKYQ